jgi:LysR family transcriptional regulator, transcriptional activator of nhaA
MEWLNYHHLLYFWTVARTGSIANASKELLLAPPTISAQVSRLEHTLGEKLFARSGRRLVLTEAGRVVFRYAEDIFGLGRELMDTLKDRPTGRALRVQIGVADVLPKLIAHDLIAPALQVAAQVHVVCREDRPERLLAELAVNELDVVLADAPMGPPVKIHAFNHLLGECGLGFYAKPKLASKRLRDFPHSLDRAPFLLPSDETAVRPRLDQWFESQHIRPAVVGEFDDFSLLRTLAEAGLGVFAAPAVLDGVMRRRYGFEPIGRTEEVRAHFYAISVERKIRNPAVIAICEGARPQVFGRKSESNSRPMRRP